MQRTRAHARGRERLHSLDFARARVRELGIGRLVPPLQTIPPAVCVCARARAGGQAGGGILVCGCVCMYARALCREGIQIDRSLEGQRERERERER